MPHSHLSNRQYVHNGSAKDHSKQLRFYNRWIRFFFVRFRFHTKHVLLCNELNTFVCFIISIAIHKFNHYKNENENTDLTGSMLPMNISVFRSPIPHCKNKNE